jgi:carbon starvation protein
VPKLLKHYYFNAGLAVVVMLAIAVPNGYKVIWPVFGAANQLLAALTLATVSIWLAFRLRPTWFTLVPAVFMMLTCLASLALILKGQFAALADPLAAPNWAVLIVALLLALLGVGVVLLAGAKLWEVYSGRREPIRTDPADAFLAPGVQHKPEA